MNIDPGQITKSEIAESADGAQAHILQANLTEGRDTRLIELLLPPGEDSVPETGSTLLVFDLGGRRFGLLLNDGVVPEAVEGEKLLYSSLGTSKAAALNMRTNGDIEINGDADNAVRFAPLQAALNTLAGFINTQLGLIAAEIVALGGSYAPPTLTIDITAAQVVEVKFSA